MPFDGRGAEFRYNSAIINMTVKRCIIAVDYVHGSENMGTDRLPQTDSHPRSPYLLSSTIDIIIFITLEGYAEIHSSNLIFIDIMLLTH